MDTRFLETLVTVVREGSLAGAARALNLTPAAVALRIHTLEQELGTPLVTRAGRNVIPTAAGAAVAARAPRLLSEIGALSVVAGDGYPRGELRIGAISSAITGMMPSILKRMVKTYAAIDVYLEPGRSPELYHQVIDGALDVAIMVQPPFSYSKSFLWKQLRSEPFILLAPASTSGEPLDIIRRYPFIRYDRRYWGGRLVDRYLRSQRIATNDRFELDAIEAIAVMVDSELGVAVVPDWAEPWPSGLRIQKIPLPEPAPVRRVGLFWQRSSPRTAVVEAFCRIASEGG